MTAISLARRLGLFVLGAVALVLALECLKAGARALAPLFEGAGIDGPASALGAGWLMACAMLSGSPAAAVALALLAAGSLSTEASYGMLAGSRLGAAFVVLAIGAIDDIRHGRREKKSSYIGVAAILVTNIIYWPAFGIGYIGLQYGAFEGLRLEGRALGSFLSAATGPVVGAAREALPPWGLFLCGIVMLLLALALFDKALPEFEEERGPFGLRAGIIYKPWVMFAVGLLVTSVTMSVSVSISILVPLAAKGYIRRENLFPYMMGANITTFVDTLFAGALVGHPDAVRAVALLMASVTALTIPVVFLFPYRFERAVDAAARAATASARALLLFVALFVGIPFILIFVF